MSFSHSFSTAASSFASLSPLISFSRAVTLALFTLSSSEKAPSSPPCSSSSSVRRGGDAFQLGGELVDGRLLLGEVAGDDEGLGHEVAGPALVLLLALLVLLDDAVGLGLPAVGGDEVAVVLHGLGPVVHQVLVDVVGVDERLAGVVGEQVLGQGGDDFLRMAAGLQAP